MRYTRCKESVLEMMRFRLMSRERQLEIGNSAVEDVKAAMAGDVCWAIDTTLNKCGNILRTCFGVSDIRDINKKLLDKLKILLDSIKVSIFSLDMRCFLHCDEKFLHL